MYSPTHYYMSVTSGDPHMLEPCFTGRSLSSGVELPEVLDVPGVLDGDPVLCLQARGARLGDMGNPKWALHMGESLCSPSLESTRLRTRSPALSVLEQTLWQWYRCNACWYLTARSAA